MSLSVEPNWYFRPWFYSPKKGEKPSIENIQRAYKDQKPNYLSSSSPSTSLGVGGFLLGITGYLFGLKNENSFFKTISGGLALLSGLSFCLGKIVFGFNLESSEKVNSEVDESKIVKGEKIKIEKKILEEIKKTIGSKQPEQGGMLGTSKNNGTITHFYFDKNAETTGTSYKVSGDKLATVLNNEWTPNGIIIAGIIHSHPSHDKKPSQEDIDYAKKMLEANSYLKKFLLPIVIGCEENKIEILGYEVTLKDGKAELKQADIEFIEDAKQ